MGNKPNRLYRRKRSGRSVRNEELRDIHSKIRGGRAAQDGHNLHGTSITALAADRAKYCEISECEETVETHIVPRRSITRKQYLGVFPARVETEAIKTHQRDKRTGELIETTDNRIVWKSDRTLLRRGNPFSAPYDIKRKGQVAEGLNTRNQFVPDRDVDREFNPDGTVLGPAAPDNDTIED